MSVKVVLLGTSGVGKTSLIQVKVNGSMGDQLATIQPQEIHYSKNINGTEVKVSVWDTPGQYTFRNMVKNFLRGAVGIIFTYDVSNRETFDELEDWYHFVSETIKPSFVILVANKCDLDRQVDSKEEIEWTSQHGIQKLIQTSAKTKEGVELLFDTISEYAYQFRDNTPKSDVPLSDDTKNGKKKKKCCQ